jgi:hypothetical protein
LISGKGGIDHIEDFEIAFPMFEDVAAAVENVFICRAS